MYIFFFTDDNEKVKVLFQGWILIDGCKAVSITFQVHIHQISIIIYYIIIHYKKQNMYFGSIFFNLSCLKINI